MSIKLNWEKICAVYKDLSKSSVLTDNTKIIFIMVMDDRTSQKHQVKFKDFMSFLWATSENPNKRVVNFVVKDEEGRILYRYKTLTNGNEEIPIGGNENVVVHWSALNQLEKDTYIRLLVSQIEGYDR